MWPDPECEATEYGHRSRHEREGADDGETTARDLMIDILAD
jgi:hypothetical protein